MRRKGKNRIEESQADPELGGLLEIDPTGLDVEWLEQPGRFFSVSKLWSEAKKNLAQLEQLLDEKSAKVEKRIRKDPERYGIVKFSEGAVKSVLQTNEDLNDLKRKLIEVQYEVDVLGNATRAMDKRKDALQNLVQLCAMEYFSAPSAPRGLATEWKKAAKKQRRENAVNLMKSRMKERTKRKEEE